jgi:hypothetical protein
MYVHLSTQGTWVELATVALLTVSGLTREPRNPISKRPLRSRMPAFLFSRYTACDVGTLPNQTWPNGTSPTAAKTSGSKECASQPLSLSSFYR